MIRHRTFLPALISLCLAALGTGCIRLPARQNTDRLNHLLQSGIEALRAGDYDGAVRQFDGGLALSPNHPTFLANKSVAVRLRGTARYNASINLADEAAEALDFMSQNGVPPATRGEGTRR